MLVPGHPHDLFVSYAHAEASWVDAFKRAFCQEFHDRAGKAVSIWQDSVDLRPGTKWTDELKRGVEDAAAVLAIVSPSYQTSRWCKEERDYLLRHYGGLEGLKVHNSYRLFKILKLPTEQHLLKDLQDIRFFRTSTKEPFPLESQEFKVAISSAVRAVRELFRHMTNSQASVYLASGSIEMEDDRSQLDNELTSHGYRVRPEFALDESYGSESLVKEMEPCSRAVFLLGGSYDTFMETQINQAIAFGKPCLFWIHPRLEQTESLLRQIREDWQLPAGSEILGGQSIPGLWPSLEAKLKDRAEPEPTPRTPGDKPRVYLIFDATLTAESKAAAKVSWILNDRQLEVIESTNFDRHRDLMTTSDAALLLRTTKPEPDDWWLNIVAPELILSRQFASKALVLADSKRLKLNPGDVPVVAYADPFSPQALDPFVEKLRRARGANAGR